MRRLPVSFLMLYGLVICRPANVAAGCPNCAMPSPPVFPVLPAAPEYEWRVLDDEEIVLYRFGRQFGNYRLADGLFFRLLATGRFEGEASEPPLKPRAEWLNPSAATAKRKCRCCSGCTCGKKTCQCKPGDKCAGKCTCRQPFLDEDDGAPPFFGVLDDKRSATECYTRRGNAITKAETMRSLLEGRNGTVPDDTVKLSFTVIAPDAAFRARVKADMKRPELAAFKAHVVEQYYDPAGTQCAMLDCGFPLEGQHVLVQTKSGKVLAHVHEYQGTETLAAIAGSKEVVGELRKKDPNYNGTTDPDPTKPPPRPASVPASGGMEVSPEALVVVLLVVLGVVVFLVLRQQR